MNMRKPAGDPEFSATEDPFRELVAPHGESTSVGISRDSFTDRSRALDSSGQPAPMELETGAAEPAPAALLGWYGSLPGVMAERRTAQRAGRRSLRHTARQHRNSKHPDRRQTMRSNDDSLRAATAHHSPKLGRDWKQQTPSRKQSPNPGEDNRPRSLNQNHVEEPGSVDGQMNRRAVVSSDLISVGYEHRTMTLELEFCNGEIYICAGVPECIYQGLMSAPLKGIYYHDHIEHNYPSVKVS